MKIIQISPVSGQVRLRIQQDPTARPVMAWALVEHPDSSTSVLPLIAGNTPELFVFDQVGIFEGYQLRAAGAG